jgi:hypothetical protein
LNIRIADIQTTYERGKRLETGRDHPRDA